MKKEIEVLKGKSRFMQRKIKNWLPKLKLLRATKKHENKRDKTATATYLIHLWEAISISQGTNHFNSRTKMSSIRLRETISINQATFKISLLIQMSMGRVSFTSKKHLSLPKLMKKISIFTFIPQLHPTFITQNRLQRPTSIEQLIKQTILSSPKEEWLMVL